MLSATICVAHPGAVDEEGCHAKKKTGKNG